MSTTTDTGTAGPGQTGRRFSAHTHEAHRDVLAVTRRLLADDWDLDRPRIAMIEHDGILTVYLSTVRPLGPACRDDIRQAVRAALAEYSSRAAFTQVVFLLRGPVG